MTASSSQPRAAAAGPDTRAAAPWSGAVEGTGSAAADGWTAERALAAAGFMAVAAAPWPAAAWTEGSAALAVGSDGSAATLAAARGVKGSEA